MIQKGYFIITDITGYTIFLTQAELDHAHHIIEALFDVQLDSISKPLQISNFQGDAILCYVSETKISNTKDVLTQIQKIYQAFSGKTAEMQTNTPCGCNACINISTLDLKIFIHYGEYIVKQIGDREEILGSDVILVHRMMKNQVRATTGIESYLLFSKQAYDRLTLKPEDLPVIPYKESYEHIGEVEMYVGDLSVN